MARQFNQIPPICEQAEYHLFQREKVEVQLPELSLKIGERGWGTIAPPAELWFTALLDAGIGAMTWSPLASGIISGKYAAGIPACSRASLKVRSVHPSHVCSPREEQRAELRCSSSGSPVDEGADPERGGPPPAAEAAGAAGAGRAPGVHAAPAGHR